MRISNEEKEYIIKNFKDSFNFGKLYIFGSRIDENKKGGDLDLFIEYNRDISFQAFYKMLKKFRKKLHILPYYKVDIIYHLPNKEIKNIHKEAKNGILLYERSMD